jgi:hypothetical protein
MKVSMVKRYKEWLLESEGSLTEKVKADFEKWVTSLGLEHWVHESSFDEEVSFNLRMMGVWSLSYEKSKTKGRQDSMYRQTYNTGSTYKWYISYPAPHSQYNYRSNVKSGNFKTFKALIEKFLKVNEKIQMMREFLSLIDEEEFKDLKVSFSGKNLKDLEADIRITRDGNIYTGDEKWKGRYGEKGSGGGLQFQREEFDPETGALFCYSFLGTRTMLNQDLDTKILSIVDAVRDLPVGKAWEVLKSGDWEEIATHLRGSISGKRYGV